MEWFASSSPALPALLGAAGFSPNLFDALLLGLLGYGGYKGKQDGASGTWLSFIQWLCIALPGGLMGGLFGAGLRALFGAGPFWSQIIGYSLWILLVCCVFGYLYSKGKDEAIDGDKFGRLEYPLGVLAGVLKGLFILLTVMSFLNGRVYTSQVIEASRANQIKEFGTTLFPTVPMLHHMAFNTSFSGPRLKTAFGWALLQPYQPVTRR